MNLTIDEMRTIVGGSSGFHDETHYCFDVESYTDGFDEYGACEHCILVDDLRTAIATHDLKPCSHGYDIACLICGFGTENGVRVWRKQIDSDDVTDIRNHVSPNTVVIER